MISVTALSAYMYCKRKLFLDYVLKISEPPKKALVNGTIRHQTYDGINKVEEGIVKSIKTEAADEIFRLYAKEYSKILRGVILKNKYSLRSVQLPLTDAFELNWKFFLAEAETRAMNVAGFIEKEKVFGKELWEKLTPKILSEVRLVSESLGLRGVVDQVEDHCGGAVVPVELKTGKMPAEGVWPGHKVQIAAYMLMLAEKRGCEIGMGYVKYLDANERREIKMNPFLKEEIAELAGKVQALLNGKELPDFCGNDNKCNACGIREMCYNKEGLDRRIKILTLA